MKNIASTTEVTLLTPAQKKAHAHGRRVLKRLPAGWEYCVGPYGGPVYWVGPKWEGTKICMDLVAGPKKYRVSCLGHIGLGRTFKLAIKSLLSQIKDTARDCKNFLEAHDDLSH